MAYSVNTKFVSTDGRTLDPFQVDSSTTHLTSFGVLLGADTLACGMCLSSSPRLLFV